MFVIVLQASSQVANIEITFSPENLLYYLRFVLEQPRKYITPWPIHDGAWGPNPRMYQCGLDLISEPGPTIVSWGGRTTLTFEKAFDVLLMFQLCDKNGEKVDHKVS